MKVAFCLSGNIGGMGGKNSKGAPVDFEYCYNSYYKNIISRNDTDVFIHSWSTEFGKELIELYKPVKAIIEPQKEFPDIKKLKFGGGKGTTQLQFFRIRSRAYSMQQVMRLKKQFEIDNDFIYDVVMLTRFDLIWHTPVDFSVFNMDFFYILNWNKIDYEFKTVSKDSKNPGLINDLWFFSNSKFMNYLGDIYNELTEVNRGDPHTFIAKYLFRSDEIRNKIKYIFYEYFDCDVYRRRFERRIGDETILKGDFTIIPGVY